MRQLDPSPVAAPSRIDAAEAPAIAGALSAAQFEHDGWRVCIAISGHAMEDFWSGYADLSRTGALQCRIVLAGQFSRREEVIAMLEFKARAAIESRNAGAAVADGEPGASGS